MTKPMRIDPEGWYDTDSLYLHCGLAMAKVEKARKSGELRSTTRGGRVLYLGRWVQEWLTGEPAERQLQTA